MTLFHNKQNKLHILKITQLTATLLATDCLAKQMKKDGFNFVGSVSVCAFAICTGLIYVRPDSKGLEPNPVHALTLQEQEK